MTDTTYTAFSTPAVGAAWLNDVNITVYRALGTVGGVAPVTPLDVLTNLVSRNKGIPFSNLDNADSQTLDWYKQGGTFTPGLTFGGGNTGMTGVTSTGFYLRIGKLVFFELQLSYGNKGSSTGAAAITGLPFAAKNTNNFPVTPIFTNLFTALTGAAGALVQFSSTQVNLFDLGNGTTGATALTDAKFSNVTPAQIQIAGCYMAA